MCKPPRQSTMRESVEEIQAPEKYSARQSALPPVPVAQVQPRAKNHAIADCMPIRGARSSILPAPDSDPPASASGPVDRNQVLSPRFQRTEI